MITIFGIPFLRQEFIQNEEFSTYRNTVKNIMLDLNMAPYVKLIDRIYDDINFPPISSSGLKAYIL